MVAIFLKGVTRMRLSVIKRIILLVLVFILVLPQLVVSGTTQDDLDAAKQEQTNIEKELKETEEKLNSLAKDRSDTEAYVRGLDAQQAAIDTELNALNIQIEAKEAEIAENEIKLEEAKIKSAEQYEAMKLRIQYMYEQNSVSYLESIIGANSMADMLNKVEYINKITEYDREALNRYIETEQMIADTEELLRSDHEILVSTKNSVEAKKAALQLVQETKQQELAKLKKDEATAAAYKKKMDDDLAAQEALIKKIEAQIIAESQANSGGNNNTFIPGKYLWPVPASHRVTSPYGDMSGRTSPHKGIDIGASVPGRAGDQILAVNGGKVVIATYSLSAGNYVMIYHGDGLYTRYLHCSSLLVSVGQTVSAGQVVGLMGTTGNSTGVHLHFDVRLNGVYVNPNPYIGY